MRGLEVRATVRDDIPGLGEVLDATGLFPAGMLPDMLAPFLAGEEGAGLWLTGVTKGDVAGFCHALSEPLAGNVWNMLALAVIPSRQGGGCGRALTGRLEAALAARGARLLLAETSGIADYAPARAFYLAAGYVEEARIRDFWAPGDDKVVFVKPLDGSTGVAQDAGMGEAANEGA